MIFEKLFEKDRIQEVLGFIGLYTAIFGDLYRTASQCPVKAPIAAKETNWIGSMAHIALGKYVTFQFSVICLRISGPQDR